MHGRPIGAAVVGLMLGAQLLAAQEPGPPGRGHMMMMQDSAGMMRMMDSLDQRLETLVLRMNQASGERKLTAVAEVINELVAQRKAMRGHMRMMMESHRMMRRDTAAPHRGMPRPDS